MRLESMMRMLWTIGLAVMVSTAAAQEPPAAVVVKVEGTVVVQPGDREGAAGTQLAAGDRIEPAAGAQAVVVHRTGRTQVVTEPLTIEAPDGGGTEGGMFAKTVGVLAQAATSDARRTGNRQGMIRPLPGGPAPIAPRNGVAVYGTRPSFSWFGTGASAYTIQVRTEGERPVRFEVEGDTTFTWPEEAELRRGVTYHWTVAPEGGRPVKEEVFEVLSEEALAELHASLGEIEEMGLDPRDDGRLLAAAAHVDLGLHYRAADILAELEEAGAVAPDVFLLKGEVLDALGRFEEARAAFDHADRMMR